MIQASRQRLEMMMRRYDVLEAMLPRDYTEDDLDQMADAKMILDEMKTKLAAIEAMLAELRCGASHRLQ